MGERERPSKQSTTVSLWTYRLPLAKTITHCQSQLRTDSARGEAWQRAVCQKAAPALELEAAERHLHWKKGDAVVFVKSQGCTCDRYARQHFATRRMAFSGWMS